MYLVHAWIPTKKSKKPSRITGMYYEILVNRPGLLEAESFIQQKFPGADIRSVSPFLPELMILKTSPTED